MGQRVIDKITRLAPNFGRSIIRHTTFTPRHMRTMFGAPGGDYCHGLLQRTRSGPTVPTPKALSDNRFRSTDCIWATRAANGGPGIAFIPGYNAAHQALAGLGR